MIKIICREKHGGKGNAKKRESGGEAQRNHEDGVRGTVNMVEVSGTGREETLKYLGFQGESLDRSFWSRVSA